MSAYNGHCNHSVVWFPCERSVIAVIVIAVIAVIVIARMAVIIRKD